MQDTAIRAVGTRDIRTAALCFAHLALLLGGLRVAAAADEARLLRYPDISASQIVFVHADMLWLAPLAGGVARPITRTASGYSYPKFSPDGTMLAYSAKTDENVDVYVVPVAGGIPRRLTHHPAADILIDWSADGRTLLYASTMASPRARYRQLFSVSANGGLPERWPLPYVETAAMSTDGKQLIFTYLKDFQQDEAWKRYRGGRAPDLWSYDLATGTTQVIAPDDAPDSTPMPAGDTLYFLSERGANGRSNIWKLAAGSSTPTPVTNFADADVRHPSLGPGGIVFEARGQLYRLDIASNRFAPVSILADTVTDALRPAAMQTSELVVGGDAGTGGKIAFESRGDVFVYDLKSHIAENLTRTAGVAERYPSLAPDGLSIAYFSDASGEYELQIQSLVNGATRRVGTYESGFRYRPFWSPNGKWLAFMDSQQMIWLVDATSGQTKNIDRGHGRYHWDMSSFRIAWSHDSRWIAYSHAGENRNQRLYVFDVAQSKLQQLTSGYYDDFNPVFDPGGNYLLALSRRIFSPVFGDANIDQTWTYANTTAVAVIPLRADVSVPDPRWQKPDQRAAVSIEFQGIEQRLRLLPAKPGNLSDLVVFDGGYAILRAVNSGAPEGNRRLEKYLFGREEPVLLAAGKELAVLDASGSRFIVQQDKDYQFLDADQSAEAVNLKVDRLRAVVDRAAENQQMFREAWRYVRDFFYDGALHGRDWQAIGDSYRSLVQYACSDDDMTFIVREMIGELGAGHVYTSVAPPAARGDARNVGLLGVDYGRKNDAYYVQKIYRTGPRQFEYASPLDAAGVPVGSFILAVNGRPLLTSSDPWAGFEGLADQEVELTVADNAAGRNQRRVKVKTLASEAKLRELAWVEDNRRYVETQSNGRIGYIYVPNTGTDGQTELMIQYRAQFEKAGLVVDERFNSGGALGDRMVELLNRPVLSYFVPRSGDTYTMPVIGSRAPKVLLTNGWSYSGGDGFPFLFKTAGVGPLIGTRTWGGLIGPEMHLPLINGGFVSVPPMRVANNKGGWAEGNEGVRPTIEQENDPGRLAKGEDQQLDRGIEAILKSLRDQAAVSFPALPSASK